MVWGLRVKNKFGRTQIDGVYRNLALTAKGTGVASTYKGGNAGGYYEGVVSITGTNPVIAFANSPGVTLRVMTQSGSTFNFYVWCKNLNQSFEYFIFDNVELASPVGNYGIRLRQPGTNNIYFDSRLPYMRVLDFRSMFWDYQNSAPYPTDSASYGVGKIAVVPSQSVIDNAVQLVGVTPNIDVYTFFEKSVHFVSGGNWSTSVDVLSAFYFPLGSGIPPEEASALCRYAQTVVIDVTGY